MAAITDSSKPAASSLPEGVPPLPENATPEQKDQHWFKHIYAGDKMPQLTLRAVLMGGILGMLMCSANLYTTLKIGWSFGVAITACVMSFTIWNAFRIMTGGALSKMSVLENNCMQSAASAAGYSTGSTIATMFGALLLLQQGDSETIKTLDVQPWWIVTAFTFCTGMMGVFLAIPMKRQMINHEQLPFPSGIAAAETLRSLYSESKEAVHKAYSLIIALFASALIGILNTGEGTLNFLDKIFGNEEKKINGPLHALRLPDQIPDGGFATVTPADGKLHAFWNYLTTNAAGEKTLLGKKLIQCGVEPSVLLIAAGMIVGLRVSLTMLAGSIALYFFVTPPLVAADAATAASNAAMLADPALLAQNAKTAGLTVEQMTKQINGFHPSFELIAGGTTFHVYRWALWGGTALMVMSSLTALAFQWKTMGRAIAGALSARKPAAADSAEAMKQIEVPFWWMLAGMIPLTIAMVFLQVKAFEINWWAGVIAVAMSFILSLVACRATGETDTTPIGAMGKVMQITFALLAPKSYVANLASAGIAANSASSSADLLTDLKSGYLLGANPRKQFLAQFFGVFFGTVAIIPVWYLMVPTKKVLESYPAPGTQTWYRVAQVLTQGISSLPHSAVVALVVGGILGIILPCVEKFIVPEKWKPYWPSTMGLGLSWVVGFNNSLAFAIGAVLTFIWTRLHKKSAETFNIPVASGLVAGESLMKALIAMLATASGIFKWGL